MAAAAAKTRKTAGRARGGTGSAARPARGRRGYTPITPLRVQAARSMSRLAKSIAAAAPDGPTHQHVMDAARQLRAGNEEASQRHLRAAMFSVTPQSLMRNGIHADDDHIAARAAMHGIHRHLLMVKDIADVGARNQALIRRDSYGEDGAPPPPPHADTGAGYGPGALAARPTAQPGADRALNAPTARVPTGGPDPSTAAPKPPRKPRSRQFAYGVGASGRVYGLGTLALSAETGRLAVTPAPRGRPGGPGLYDVKGNMHSPYLQNIVKALIRRGMPPGKAYAVAWGAIRRWSRGGGKVHPEVRAAAGGALGLEKIAEARAGGGHKHANTWDELGALIVDLAWIPDPTQAQWAVIDARDGHFTGVPDGLKTGSDAHVQAVHDMGDAVDREFPGAAAGGDIHAAADAFSRGDAETARSKLESARDKLSAAPEMHGRRYTTGDQVANDHYAMLSEIKTQIGSAKTMAYTQQPPTKHRFGFANTWDELMGVIELTASGGAARTIDLVGKKGYIHGYIYVGGPGLPSVAEHNAKMGGAEAKVSDEGNHTHGVYNAKGERIGQVVSAGGKNYATVTGQHQLTVHGSMKDAVNNIQGRAAAARKGDGLNSLQTRAAAQLVAGGMSQRTANARVAASKFLQSGDAAATPRSVMTLKPRVGDDMPSKGYSLPGGLKAGKLQRGDKVMASYSGGRAGLKMHDVTSVRHDDHSVVTFRNTRTGKVHTQRLDGSAQTSKGRADSLKQGDHVSGHFRGDPLGRTDDYEVVKAKHTHATVLKTRDPDTGEEHTERLNSNGNVRMSRKVSKIDAAAKARRTAGAKKAAATRAANRSHAHANTWDELMGVINLTGTAAGASQDTRSAVTGQFVPAGQGGAKGGGNDRSKTAHPVGGATAPKSGSRAQQRASLSGKITNARHRVAALQKQAKTLQGELASASGKTSSGQSGSTTSSGASTTASNAAATSATTSSTTSGSTTSSSGSTTSSNSSSSSSTASTKQVAAWKSQLAGITRQISALNSQIAGYQKQLGQLGGGSAGSGGK